MAREAARISTKPSEAQKGGTLGVPVGAKFKITDARWTTWSEAGEKAIKRDRSPADPALMVVFDVANMDDPVTEFLSAGKEKNAKPSRDGEFLEPGSSTTATALSDNCNAMVFLNSIFYDGKDQKSDAYKRHKKNALNEDLMDDGISKALVGLEGIAGRIVVEREGLQTENKPRPTLVVDEIIEPPSGEGATGKSSRSASASASGRSRREERERDTDTETEKEDDDRGGRGRSSRRSSGAGNGKADADDVMKATEKLVLSVLDQSKYKNGLSVKKSFQAVYTLAKGEDNEKEIMALVEDEDWLTDGDRPWSFNKKDDVIELA
jgi:hypothetical protein